MALLAGGMIFTSCDKKYTLTVLSNNDAWGTVTGGGSYLPDENVIITAIPNAGYQFVQWSDGNKTNPRTVLVNENLTYTAIFEPVSQNETKITFNGNSWVAANAVGVDYTSENYITFYFYKVLNSEQEPYAMGFLESVPGTFDFETSGGDIMSYRDVNHLFTDIDGFLGDAGEQYWGWQSMTNTFVEHITAVDLNALSISGDWSVEVGDVETYATTGNWGTLVPFTGVMTNANWVMQQPTGKANTKKVKTNALATVK